MGWHFLRTNPFFIDALLFLFLFLKLPPAVIYFFLGVYAYTTSKGCFFKS